MTPTLEDAQLPQQERLIATSSGASAALKDQGETREVRDPGGRLLFQYESLNGRCSVFAPAGDLELHAPEGSIRLVAGRSVKLEGRGQICAEGALGIALRSGRAGERSELNMARGRVRLGSETLQVEAAGAELALGRVRYVGDEAQVRVERGSFVFATLETTAKRVWEKAKEVYRQVEGLHYEKAGRLRSLVRG
jgi:hypothetical protein